MSREGQPRVELDIAKLIDLNLAVLRCGYEFNDGAICGEALVRTYSREWECTNEHKVWLDYDAKIQIKL